MAQRVQIILGDDFDGGEETQIMTFGFGVAYEIDLNDKNARGWRRPLAPFIEAGRTLGKSPATRGRESAGDPMAAEVYKLSLTNGHDVPARGRIPARVREAYDAVH
jgi:hypothetical protein